MSTITPQTLNKDLVSIFEGYLSTNPEKNSILKLQHTGFPGRKDEEYRFTPLTDSLLKNIQQGFTIGSSIKKKNSGSIIPGAVTIRLYNGIPDSEIKLPQGTELVDLTPSDQKDAFGILNECFRGKALSLKIQGKIHECIHLEHICSSENEVTLSFPSIQLLVENGSEVLIVETFELIGSNYHFNAPVLEAMVEDNAVFNYCRIQNSKGSFDQVYNSLIKQKSGSVVNAFVLTTEGNIVRNNFTIEINGEKAEGNLMGLYLLDGKTLGDNHTIVDHQVPNSNSNEMFKGVLFGDSKGVFNGKIFVRQDAQKTNAFQSNRNIILSESASVNTKPQLEIWADDVKCSHGCTTGQLDDEALFYLESRGIDKPSAQSMLLDAFAGEVTEKIESETLRGLIQKIVGEKIQTLK